MRRPILVVVLGVLVACKREGDHCKRDTTRCDGDVVVTCMLSGTKSDLLYPHTSNYWDRSECPEGLHCVRTGEGPSEIGCAESTTTCDPTTRPTVTESAGTISVRACTRHIGVQTFLETRQFKRCDPKTFTPTCVRGDAAKLCLRADDLKHVPATVRAALHGATVETLGHCKICGEPTKCSD